MSSMNDEGENIAELATSIETGPYILRTILSSKRLLEDGLSQNVYVTCVEFWDDNLYVGTSGADVLHYLRVAPSEDSGNGLAAFIFNGKVSINEPADPALQVPGIQQILLLPDAGKACILCNGTVSFYALPTLSLVFPTSRPHNCTWLGGIDLNGDDGSTQGSVTIMICQKSRLRLVNVGERPQKVLDIELGGCLEAVRRSDIACVADTQSYSLLDVKEQQRIPLFDISFITELENNVTAESPEDSSALSSNNASRVHSSSGHTDISTQVHANFGHSLGPKPVAADGHAEESIISSDSVRPVSQVSDANVSHSSTPPSLSTADESQLTTTNQSANREEWAASNGQPAIDRSLSKGNSKSNPAPKTKLRPNIISVNPNEFMLTTGTSYNDPGVGMFVNLDGEASRGTVKFRHYPEGLCSDGKGVDLVNPDDSEDTAEEAFVLALIDNSENLTNAKAIEIKRWDIDPSEPNSSNHFLLIPCNRQDISMEGHSHGMAGLREVLSTCEIRVTEITDILCLSRLQLQRLNSKEQQRAFINEKKMSSERASAEAKFIGRLSVSTARMLVWGHNNIYWIVRNPMIMRMDGLLRKAVTHSPMQNARRIDRGLVERTLNEIRGREPSNELEFHTLNYVRQKGAIMLFIDLIHQSTVNNKTDEQDRRVTEEALSGGELDPRVLLLMVPKLRSEVIYGAQGIWVPNGLNDIIQDLGENVDSPWETQSIVMPSESILLLIKRYLLVWRDKKGLASVSDESEVFQTVDAALLHVLLLLDSATAPGPAIRGSIRSELNAVVDHSVDCFERAVNLLEDYKRLFVLSRLYQSRKMSREVLATWRRIIEGDEDRGGEFEGETEVRRYLARINDATLLEEYGTWLAGRNPRLGVRVFADSSSRVKFQPERAVEILKRGAPRAVKDFLEYLVFEQNLSTYVNDLISYYLDTVVSELEQSGDVRSTLRRSYSSYREMQAPKPTYSQFAAEYTIDTEWWQNRLRLLELLGGNHGPASKYDVSAMFSRVEVYEQDLVPEMIILNGRRGRHRQALRLLIHSLGDFDTAIRYCVLGGSSTYSQLIGSLPQELVPSRRQQEILFSQLVEEFLKIEDVNDRVMQTSQLLERFAAWFDIEQVLTLLPDTWSVEIVSKFLENAFRNMVSERNETLITRALTNTDNLSANFDLIGRREWTRARVNGLD